MPSITRLACVICFAMALSTPLNSLANEAVIKAARSLQPMTGDIDIQPTPLDGVVEVTLGSKTVYFSEDGQYVLGGPLIRMSDRRDLTEMRRSQTRKELINNAGDLITYDYTADDATYELLVVTDIDCPYCRKLHNDMADYNAAGISMRYVMLPRAGKASASYQKAVSAACASDPEAAITSAMLGKPNNNTVCKHPIDEHMQLASQLGVGSTPTMITRDGEQIRGYLPVDRLLQRLKAIE